MDDLFVYGSAAYESLRKFVNALLNEASGIGLKCVCRNTQQIVTRSYALRQAVSCRILRRRCHVSLIFSIFSLVSCEFLSKLTRVWNSIRLRLVGQQEGMNERFLGLLGARHV
jgi:hypothetical protein